jgi:hypothetical protein
MRIPVQLYTPKTSVARESNMDFMDTPTGAIRLVWADLLASSRREIRTLTENQIAGSTFQPEERWMITD